MTTTRMLINIVCLLLVGGVHLIHSKNITCSDGNTHSIETEYLAVQFHPEVRSYSNHYIYDYTEEDIKALISLASTRFRKFSLKYYPPPKRNDNSPFSQQTFHFTPIIIAEYNAGMKSPNFKPIQVFLQPEIYQTPCSLLETISSANLLFPRTIKGVIFQLNQTLTSDPEALTYLLDIRKKLEKLNVTIGAYLPLDICEGEEVEGIFKTVEFSVFYPTQNESSANQTGEKSVEDAITKFEKCEKSVLESGLEMATHLSFLWPSRGNGKVDTKENLVKVWKSLGAWGKGKSKDVFMLSAFDTPIMSYPMSYSGWWWLKDYENKIISKGAFTEKICDEEDDNQDGINERIDLVRKGFDFKIPEMNRKDYGEESNQESPGKFGAAAGGIAIIVFLVVLKVLHCFYKAREAAKSLNEVKGEGSQQLE